MSRNTGSMKSSDRSWLNLYAAVAALPLALTACGGGGGGSPAPAPTPTPTPSPAPAASLTVTPSAQSTTPGGATITLTATVTNSTATPSWTLTGPGSLSAMTGTSVVYTPPALGAITANATAIVSASLTGVTPQVVNLAVVVTASGATWTNATSGSSANLLGVDYDDNRFVAVTDTGAALGSTDAATWTPITLFTSGVSTDHLAAYAISHTGSTYVAGGATSSAPYSTSTGVIASSADGVTWTRSTLPAGTPPIHGFIVSPTRVVALSEGGQIYVSTDNSTYSLLTTISHPVTLNAGAYGVILGGVTEYVGVADGGYVAASPNGTTFGSTMVFPGGPNMHGVAWTGTQFVAVGDNGTISTSTNGTAWSTLKTSAISGTLRSVTVTPTGLIVVVGDNGIETSPDGNTWTASNGSGVVALSGVTYGGGNLVAVGAAGAIKTSEGN